MSVTVTAVFLALYAHDATRAAVLPMVFLLNGIALLSVRRDVVRLGGEGTLPLKLGTVAILMVLTAAALVLR
jgi:hypothetical protein